MEPVEQRRLMTATVTSSTESTISDLSGAAYFGAVAFGCDGAVYGPATVGAGTGGETSAEAYTTWDSNLDDGLDSGYVPFLLKVNVGGDGVSTMEASDSGVMTFATGATAGVHQVEIQAAVAGPSMQMDWRDVTVNFYRGGQLVESVNVGGLSADTMDSGSYDPAESIAKVTTDASDYDGVSVVGEVRMVAAQGVYPNPTDIFGQVAIS
jgi:hypothetical protein